MEIGNREQSETLEVGKFIVKHIKYFTSLVMILVSVIAFYFKIDTMVVNQEKILNKQNRQDTKILMIETHLMKTSSYKMDYTLSSIDSCNYNLEEEEKRKRRISAQDLFAYKPEEYDIDDIIK